jgi:hypothetical protein
MDVLDDRTQAFDPDLGLLVINRVIERVNQMGEISL